MRYSHVVSHHSTNLTSGRLTSGIRRDPVLLTVYGRNWKLNRYVGLKGLGWVRGGIGLNWMDWMTVACGFDTTTFGIFSNSLFSSDSRHSIFIASSFHPHPSNERILNLREFWAGFVFTFSLFSLFLHQLSIPCHHLCTLKYRPLLPQNTPINFPPFFTT